MSNKIRYEEVEPTALKIVPEIKQAYYDAGWERVPYPTDEWIEELYHTSDDDERRLGATILFENLLAPVIMSLFEDEVGNKKRIQEIMDWIESLAYHEDIRIRETLIGVCLCTKLLDQYGSKLPQTYPYLGPRTREICKDHAKRLNLAADVRQYLAEKG